MQPALSTKPEKSKSNDTPAHRAPLSSVFDNADAGLVSPGVPRFLRASVQGSPDHEAPDHARKTRATLPRFLQAKLTVSQRNDPSEREADDVATQIMRMADPRPSTPGQSHVESAGATPVSVQRQCAACEEAELQRVEEAPCEAHSSPDTRGVDAALREPGMPLDASVRDFFEPRFGRDFADVRVHTGTQAAASAQSVGALAYTVGSEVVFNTDQYAPHSKAGRKLLAHELTHVVQQGRTAQLGHSTAAAGLDASVSASAGVTSGIAQRSGSATIHRSCASPPVADAESTIRVLYDTDFAVFSNTVAQAIGRRMVFRTDGGDRVRTLTGPALREIYDALPASTASVTLAFTLLRCAETRRVENVRLRVMPGDVEPGDHEPDPTPTTDPSPTTDATSPSSLGPLSGFTCTDEAINYDERFVDDLNTRVVYDEETARWNRNEGRDVTDWGGALGDAWGHCYIAACMTRSTPESVTWAVGTFYEIAHETAAQLLPSFLVEHNSLTQDLYNQAVGRDIGLHYPDGDLYEICFEAMMNGRLDLTLAGVPRGRALVHP